MKRVLNILLFVFIVVVFSFSIDFLAIILLKRPLFAIKKDSKYSGIIYDTYYCDNKPIIKFKNSDYKCDYNEVVDIVDDTVTCAESLELFYEDDNYKYYFPCVKSDNIVVKYANKKTDKIKEALKNKRIRVNMLTDYNINYYKESKKDKYKLIVSYDDKENIKKVKSFDYDIYYYGIKKIDVVINNTTYDLLDAIDTNLITLDEIIYNMKNTSTYKDGGSKLYISYDLNDDTYSILKCNTLNGNNDIYIGDNRIKGNTNLCN